MRRFKDFILIDSNAELKKSEKTTLEKAKLLKEKLADANEFMNDKKNDATEKCNVAKNINYTNKAKLKSYDDMKKEMPADKKPADAKTKMPHDMPEPTKFTAGLPNKGPKIPLPHLPLGNKETKKNDPSISGTKIESPQTGELGNKNKPDDKALSPAVKDEKKPMGKPMSKSMADGGISWSEGDLKKGYMAYAGAMGSGLAEPNPNAQPLVKQESKPKQQNEPSLAQVIDMMDDSKVNT